MYKFLARNGQLMAFGVGVVLTVVFLISVFSGLSDFDALPDESKGSTSIFNVGLYASFLLIIVGAVAMLAFSILHVVSDFKGSIKGIAGLAAILIIFLIARGVGSDDTPIMNAINEFEVTEGQSKIITGAIATAIAMAGLAALTFALSEIRNFFK